MGLFEERAVHKHCNELCVLAACRCVLCSIRKFGYAATTVANITNHKSHLLCRSHSNLPLTNALPAGTCPPPSQPHAPHAAPASAAQQQQVLTGAAPWLAAATVEGVEGVTTHMTMVGRHMHQVVTGGTGEGGSITIGQAVGTGAAAAWRHMGTHSSRLWVSCAGEREGGLGRRSESIAAHPAF